MSRDLKAEWFSIPVEIRREAGVAGTMAILHGDPEMTLEERCEHYLSMGGAEQFKEIERAYAKLAEELYGSRDDEDSA